MWGQNLSASNEPVESRILWLSRPQTLRFRQLAISAFEQAEQKNPKRRGGRLRLGLGDLGSQKRHAMDYLKHTN